MLTDWLRIAYTKRQWAFIKAIIFWLKNRKPEIWKEKIEENSVDEEGSGVLILTPSQVEEIRKEVKDE